MTTSRYKLKKTLSREIIISKLSVLLPQQRMNRTALGQLEPSITKVNECQLPSVTVKERLEGIIQYEHSSYHIPSQMSVMRKHNEATLHLRCSLKFKGCNILNGQTTNKMTMNLKYAIFNPFNKCLSSIYTASGQYRLQEYNGQRNKSESYLSWLTKWKKNPNV